MRCDRMPRVTTTLLAAVLVATNAYADCTEMPGLIWATNKDLLSLKSAFAKHDREAICKAGVDAYKSEGALHAFLRNNPECASSERKAKELEVLKNLVFNLNDFCDARLPSVEGSAN